MNKFDAINAYFDAIYVISLDGYEDRKSSIKQSFDGMNYTFWPGTDKRELDENVLADKAFYDDQVHRTTKRTSRSMTLAEYACACSHRRIYENMQENGIQKALIFEDDAVVNDASIAGFTKQIQTIDNSWDVILFDYYDSIPANILGRLKQKLYLIYRTLGISNWQHVSTKLINQMAMMPYNEYFYRAGRLSGAHAYALTLDTAKKYIEYQSPIILQADRVFYYYQEIEYLNVFASKNPFFLRGEVSQKSSIQLHR